MVTDFVLVAIQKCNFSKCLANENTKKLFNYSSFTEEY